MAFNQYSLDLELSSSQYAKIADGSQTGLDLSTDFSCEAWVKLEQLPSTPATAFTILSKYESGANQRSWWFYIDASNQLRIQFTSDGSSATAQQSTFYSNALGSSYIGKWTHVACAVDISVPSAVLYIDGVAVTTNTLYANVTSIYNGSATVGLGAREATQSTNTWDSFFDGMLDDVRVWSDIRTAQEILDNYGKELVGDEAGLVGYWKLNNSYLDETSNNNDLTASGSPVFSTTVPWTGANSTDWASAEIQSDHTKVAGSSDLTNFPALIKDGNLSDAVYAGMLPGGANVTATHLVTNGSATDATSYATASISPTLGKLVLLTVINVYAPAVTTPTVTGCGMTWTQVATQLDSESYRRTTVFRGVSVGSSGALTISFGSQTQLRCGWSISEFNNVDTGGTNGSNAIVQSAGVGQDGTANTSLTVTLSAFSSTKNATYGGVRMASASNPIVAGTGFTELGLGEIESGNYFQTQFRNDNDTTVTWTWNSAGVRATGIGIELKYKNQGGEDLRFTSDSAGTTELPFEIVSLDTVAKTSEIWAKVPTLDYDNNTSLYIWYGNASALPYAATDTYGSQAVWDSAYKAIWHLQEASGNRADSTSFSNTLTDTNTVASGTGKIGTGADFESANSEQLTRADTASLSITGNITFEIWIKLEQLPSTKGSIMDLMSKWESTGDKRTYRLVLDTDDKLYIYYSSTGSWEPNVTTLASSSAIVVSGDVGNWVHISCVVTVATKSVAMYKNGSSVSVAAAIRSGASSIVDSTAVFQMGAAEGAAVTNQYFDGIIDESRLYSGLLTADWISTEYANQNEPSTFWVQVSTGVTILIGGGIIG